MKGADLKTLVETVSIATGRNFILDPKVQGKVTVVSAKSMTPEELYQVFLSILEVHGYIAIPSGGATKIVPDDKLKLAGDASGKIHGSDEIVVQIFELQHVEAGKMMGVLRPMVSPKGHLAIYQPTNMLVVADYGANVSRLARILGRVDQPASGEVEVIALQHASAIDLVRVINEMEKSAGNSPQAGNLVADERTNSVLISGSQGSRVRLRALITHLDTPVDLIGNTQVVYLRYAKAKNMVTVLSSIGENYVAKAKAAKENAAQTSSSTVNVQAYDEANALVITAPPDLLRTMETVIRKLDVRRAQVLVEAIIAEMSADKAAEFGVQWRTIPSDGGLVAGTNFDRTSQGINTLSSSTSGIPNLLSLGSGLSLGFMSGTQTLLGNEFVSLGSLLRVLKGDVATNILQTPTLVTLDNQEAEIVVAETVPFVTGSFTQATNSATNPFQTIQREDVGLTLKVTPQINEGDTIRLDIYQELSEVKETPTVGADGVVTNTRSIKTSVMVDNGKVLVLGGLIRDRTEKTNDQVPVLSEIPVLGSLFKYEQSTDNKINLMVFLRPAILRNAADNMTLTRNKYQYMRHQQLQQKPAKGALYLGRGPVTLPRMEYVLNQYRTGFNQDPAHTPMATQPPAGGGLAAPPAAELQMPDERDYDN
ncbi:putative general secretion pathway protein D [Magnetofaba australis IT-1]|uniref:Putative general secretion pathway protein D n=1 Tax=Magnetofaba australis IT-1 TaxID=1434232 RepID=A0A1Y2K972_9PROT|nr:putative general secretion pathway protein D [Magnetofaba australis IT-1]